MSANVNLKVSTNSSNDGSGTLGGVYGQPPGPSQIPSDTSAPPGLDPDWLALILVIIAGAFLFFAFTIIRFVRWTMLRRPVPTKLDDAGNTVLYRSTIRRIVGWPGMIGTKLTLVSFRLMGLPSLGMIFIISGWIGFCGFATLFRVEMDLVGIAYRLPYVGMANIPILFLAAFKNSLVGLVAGLSYEKINSFHRWVGRFIVATFFTHGILMGVLFCVREGIPFSDWVQQRFIQYGISAVSCLVLLLLLANRPTRNNFHEFFRWTHILLTLGFLLSAYYHEPATKYPILVSMSLLAKEWIFRFFKMLLPLPKAKALIFPGNVVRLTISLPKNRISRFFWKSWSPGSHVRITIPSIGLLQPHPFTIASLPSDNRIQLHIRSREGFSRRLYERTAAAVVSRTPNNFNIHFEGIYGGRYPSFAKFDVVLLIASGIGITFTVPILKDLVLKVKAIQSQERDCRCKRIGFVWVVKHRAELSWFARELAEVMDQAYGLVAMRLYVTRDDKLVPPQEKILVPIEETNFELPNNLVPFLRYSRPNLQGLVEQAADEALVLGRLGIATCGNRGLVTDVKNAAARNLKGSMPDIYCHAEEFDY